MGFGIRSRPTTPLISLNRLKALGVARVSLPRLLPAAALSGMRKALEVTKQCIASGELVDRPDLLDGIEDITRLMGYEHVAALEADLLRPEELERKYGQGERDYVIRGKSED
jgi:2-methylisocitrate lyase-like PEP mutase family enzyme